jgi:HEAT repeats
MNGILLSLFLLSPFEAEDPSDYVRVLEAGDPALWDEAVQGLLGEQDRLEWLAISSIVRRVDSLSVATRIRVARALGRAGAHPGAVATLVSFGRSENAELRSVALASLLSLRTAEALDVFRDRIVAGEGDGVSR